MKSQSLLKSIFGIAVIAVLLPIMSCDGAKNPAELLGKWVGVSGDDKDGVMEFLSDGTGTITRDSVVAITWKMEEDRFIIVTCGEERSGIYEIRDSLFMFTEDNGKTSKYAKCNKDCKEVAKEYAEAIIKAIEKGSFTDGRDNKIYKTVKLGNQTWMAENLNYNSTGSKCYEDKEINCKKYGRLYDYPTAKSACPSGWHLPNNAEWQALVDLAGGDNFAGKVLKAFSGWNENGNGTDAFGFSALPSGYGSSYGSFGSVGNTGYWWRDFEFNANRAFYIFMFYKRDDVSRNMNDKRDFYSVRCVQDSPDAKIINSSDKGYKKASVDAISWPSMPADKFGCMMEKTFGYKDERFNCSLKGYENKGGPCENTDEYYEGPAFPSSLIKKVHPWLSGISLSWEHGGLQGIVFWFDRELTEEQVLKSFGFTSKENHPGNIMSLDAENGSNPNGSFLQLQGFDHNGAADVGCGEGDEGGD
ncbi:MAG: fibrobacter succinogenes major paralogous domain-containing protein [Fibromonadaceae bacterium]|jgi:uncharacterized protein (TIGR02145 family)|nr:fibrobacter succinogenes major paralogous domain-containing protein [Fibromonadaceae bacterium]